jgi:hypothetical protein
VVRRPSDPMIHLDGEDWFVSQVEQVDTYKIRDKMARLYSGALGDQVIS